MESENLLTCGEKTHSVSQRTVYLTLIAEEIKSYGAGYNLSDINLPTELAVDYLRFVNTYWGTLETCLRNFDGMKLKAFTKEYKKEITDIYSTQTNKAINEAVEYVHEKISSKERGLSLLCNSKQCNTEDANDKIKALLKRRAYHKMRDNESLTDVNKVKVEIHNLPESTVNRLEVKIRAIAENSLMIDALDHAITRASLDKPNADEEKKKYHFKKFKYNIKEVLRDLLINSSNGEIKKSMLEKSNAQVINKAVNGYEIIGKPIYLHNKRKFKKAVGQHFRPKLKKLRDSGANS
jgi:hypothetical protein